MALALLCTLAVGPVWTVDLGKPDAIADLHVRLSTEPKPKEIRFKGHYFGPVVEFGPEISGMTLRGGEFSTGKVIRGFHSTTFLGKSVWAASAPAGVGHQLFTAKQRLTRPRLPKGNGFYQFANYLGDDGKADWMTGSSGMAFKGEDLKPWHNLADVEVVCHHLWITSRLPIKSLDSNKHEVQFTKKGTFKLVDDHSGQPGFYRVENVAEALEKPGEFYYDTATKMVYVIPIPGQKPETFTAHSAGDPTALRIKGAHDVTVEGVKASLTEYNYPATQSGDPQAAVSVPSAMELVDCTKVTLRKCRVEHVGDYGLSLLGRSKGNSVEECVFDDLGGGGLKIDHGTSATRVVNCSITRGGRVHAPAVGMWVGNSSHNQLIRNTISDLYYTGISVGWTWGYADHDGQDNIIEGNEISNIGQGELSDMGGIYHLGVAPGTVIRANSIVNVRSRGYGGWGIYLDEGSSEIVVEQNVVKYTKSGGFHQHYGRNNIIRNNIFAFAETDGMVIRSREEAHLSFTFENNVVVSNGTPIVGGNWTNGNYIFRNNVLWAGGKELPLPKGATGNVWKDPHVKK